MKKPTIAELEEFLNKPESTRPLEVLPDGCVIGWYKFPPKKIQKLLHPMRHIKTRVSDWLRWVKHHEGKP